MYAVIKTGGKQYRVQPGDLLVVEKLDGEPGAEVAFGEVLLLGDGADVTVGAPTVAGASVAATLVETRKGEKVKIFKKIRRQGYRRTKGHRQLESVLRVTGLTVGGKETKWDGTVDLTTKAELDLRARNLAKLVKAADVTPAGVEVETVVAKGKKSSPKVEAVVVEHADAAPVEAAPAKKAAPKKAAAPKAKKDTGGEA
ncbi:MAG: 50S ribosomal protein L21 [Caulobacterales bacterium 68-7]|nr:50S ribosomal protein L21 [Caulobacterales bacterium]OJU14119.1 MAG: 50S ribosomal protein L21 [Caulobacterales bacterium 68-7]